LVGTAVKLSGEVTRHNIGPGVPIMFTDGTTIDPAVTVTVTIDDVATQPPLIVIVTV